MNYYRFCGVRSSINMSQTAIHTPIHPLTLSSSTPPWRLPSNQLLLHSSWFFLSSLLVHHLSLFLYYMYGLILMAMRNNIYSGFLLQVVKRQKQLSAIFWKPAFQIRSVSQPVLQMDISPACVPPILLPGTITVAAFLKPLYLTNYHHNKAFNLPISLLMYLHY